VTCQVRWASCDIRRLRNRCEIERVIVEETILHVGLNSLLPTLVFATAPDTAWRCIMSPCAVACSAVPPSPACHQSDRWSTNLVSRVFTPSGWHIADPVNVAVVASVVRQLNVTWIAGRNLGRRCGNLRCRRGCGRWRGRGRLRGLFLLATSNSNQGRQAGLLERKLENVDSMRSSFRDFQKTVTILWLVFNRQRAATTAAHEAEHEASGSHRLGKRCGFLVDAAFNFVKALRVRLKSL